MNMHVLNIRTFFLLMLSSACVSCMEIDPLTPPKPRYYLDQEFKDYTSFAQGTYRVYTEASSGEEDSVYMYSQRTYFEDGSYHKDPFKEAFQNFYTSSYYKQDTEERGDIMIVQGKSFGLLQHRRGIVESVLYFSRSVPGDTLGQGYLITHSEDVAQVTLSNGMTFNDVKVYTTYDTGGPYSYEVKKVYFAKGIGIIRREMYDGKVWNLSRYFIKR